MEGSILSKRRVVITGLGAVTPLGPSVNEFWNNLIDGKSGIGLIDHFDTADFDSKIGGQVKGFEPLNFIDKKKLKRTDPFLHYSISASKMAFADSGLDMEKENAEKVGVVIGSGIGGTTRWEEQHEKLLKGGPRRVSPFFVPMMIIDLAAGEVSIALGAKGPNFAPVSACATGAHAIG